MNSIWNQHEVQSYSQDLVSFWLANRRLAISLYVVISHVSRVGYRFSIQCSVSGDSGVIPVRRLNNNQSVPFLTYKGNKAEASSVPSIMVLSGAEGFGWVSYCDPSEWSSLQSARLRGPAEKWFPEGSERERGGAAPVKRGSLSKQIITVLFLSEHRAAVSTGNTFSHNYQISTEAYQDTKPTDKECWISASCWDKRL